MGKEFCKECGQPIMQHKHPFSKGLANILIATAKRFAPEEEFHLQKDLTLTKNQYNNFQKLQYWELVRKVYENGKRKGGYWFLTYKVEFILHGSELPKFAITFNKRVVKYSEMKVTLTETVGYYDLPEAWAKRAELVEDSSQLKMGFGQ